MNKAGTRFFFGRFVSARATMSTGAVKKPTHYDTLEINSRATQGEIKSAYFKLSKQCHPDKNSSKAATEKFRNITEAYEVLGNFASRKTYDRGLLVKTRHQGRQRVDNKDDSKIKFYQDKAAVFRDDQKSGAMPLYDFDAWTKAHYGRTFQRTLRDKKEGHQRRVIRMELSHPEFNINADYSVLAIALVSLVAIFFLGIPSPKSRTPEPFLGMENALNTTESSLKKSSSDATTRPITFD